MIAHVQDDLTDHSMMPGDRVELPGCNRCDRFGLVVELQELEVCVALADGSVRWVSRQSCWYAPSLEVIRQRADTIQSDWSDAERRSRSGYYWQDHEPLSVPLVHDRWDASIAVYGEVI